MRRDQAFSNNKNLVLKDYLETASDASRRTRFNTIVMLVASVLVFVSILNSADFGWITLRLRALRHKTSAYTVRKFPLLCECDKQVQEKQKELCESLEKEEGPQDLLWKIREINREIKGLAAKFPLDPGAREVKRKALESNRQELCNEEYAMLTSLYDAMQKSASDTKYTVRVPFFGIAFDINDIGILGGFSLWIILILLRLSLRHQIISLRVGFKEAFAGGHEKDFYQILAARQVFVFPYLSDPNQSAAASFGWIELWWRESKGFTLYHGVRIKLIKPLVERRKRIIADLKMKQKSQGFPYTPEDAISPSTSNIDSNDGWHANRNVLLRLVPKLLCIVPFFVYLFQYFFDFHSRSYGYELSVTRTVVLLSLGGFFLLNLLVLGVWCMTKWNELDRLWDYYHYHIRNETKPGEIYIKEGKYLSES